MTPLESKRTPREHNEAMTCVLLLIMGSVPIPPTAFGIADIDRQD